MALSLKQPTVLHNLGLLLPTVYPYLPRVQMCSLSAFPLLVSNQISVLKHVSMHLLPDFNVILRKLFVYVFKAERSETMQRVFETIIRRLLHGGQSKLL